MRQFANERLMLPAVALASLGCLQPGIDPVFLTLLSSAHGLAPELHGWVVSATQTGMAAGAVVVWRWGTRLPEFGFVLAALVASVAALATTQTGYLPALLALRGLYGTAMGLLYTHAMSTAATCRPHGAYGAVFLLQLVLSTVIALVLPAIADFAGPKAALAALALAPLSALALAAWSARSAHRRVAHMPQAPATEQGDAGPRAWATAGATLLFICATMMVWTFSGALAVGAGIPEDTIGTAVALGSLAGAATALLVMREQPLVPPPLTGLLAGLSLLGPIVATQGGAAPFIVAIVLLNIGSTAIIVRSSGLASAASRGSLFRRFVACTHPLGMILGPLAGSVATTTFGHAGLLLAAIATIAAACLLLAAGQARSLPFRRRPKRQESLDEFLTYVQTS
ncbi:hypothetical protein SAMN05518801_103141 [Novosphingobium sp. CF614]|uniref:MFS transporter n=1 Tax=Novosphingobium sp. CF614 TaxID=1884364 RepID=UPI0008F3FF0B|nr:MFS transporter [Novosphingobium sp. CF614]SFF91468.1 hypothetical protein SAMN05518801_103141 [Novosphingobium sp. CF614]